MTIKVIFDGSRLIDHTIKPNKLVFVEEVKDGKCVKMTEGRGIHLHHAAGPPLELTLSDRKEHVVVVASERDGVITPIVDIGRIKGGGRGRGGYINGLGAPPGLIEVYSDGPYFNHPWRGEIESR